MPWNLGSVGNFYYFFFKKCFFYTQKYGTPEVVKNSIRDIAFSKAYAVSHPIRKTHTAFHANSLISKKNNV